MNENSERHINLETVRNQDQYDFYKEIEAAGVCPFCPEHYGTFARQKEVVQKGEHWYVFPNADKYDFSATHLMIAANRHILEITEINDEEWSELKEMIVWSVEEYGLDFGSLAVRFGDPFETGGSVKHLHWHIIVPDNSGVVPEERVKFPMSRKIST